VPSPDALALLTAYEWPGNVRELRNAIERAVVLTGPGGVIEPQHLPDRLRDVTPAPGGGGGDDAIDVRRKVAAVERDAVLAALDAAGGNQTHAAKRLGISRFALIRLLDKHGLKGRRR
jgi:transcriptional regulator with PAS, ATPase and Fis domain